MNLRDLRYLVSLADTRHFGRAAKACHISQPTLSAQIRKLELELGISIFERNNKSVVITRAGSAVIAKTRGALEQIDQIKLIANDYQDQMASDFRLGMIPTIAPYLIPYFLNPLSTEFPQLDLIVSESVTGELMRQLEKHEIDAAIIATSIPENNLRSIALFSEPFWVVHPSDHRFYHEDVISIRELKNENLLLLSDSHCLSEQVRTLLAQYGPLVEHNFRATSMETLLQLVSTGRGCTLIPALALSGPYMTGMGIIAKPLVEETALRHVTLVARNSYANSKSLANISRIIKQNLPNTVRVN